MKRLKCIVSCCWHRVCLCFSRNPIPASRRRRQMTNTCAVTSAKKDDDPWDWRARHASSFSLGYPTLLHLSVPCVACALVPAVLAWAASRWWWCSSELSELWLELDGLSTSETPESAGEGGREPAKESGQNEVIGRPVITGACHQLAFARFKAARN